MLGIDDIISSGLKILEKVIPDPKARDEAKLKLLELQQQGQLKIEEFNTQLAQGQIDINKIEAQSESWFKSGARPAIMWICAISFLYDFVARPLIIGFTGKIFPALDSATLTSLTFGLLGLGAYRSFDKLKK